MEEKRRKKVRKEDEGGNAREMRGKGRKGDWRGKLELLFVLLVNEREIQSRIKVTILKEKRKKKKGNEREREGLRNGRKGREKRLEG